MPNLSSNPPPDKQVTAQNIDALILQVASDPNSIMNNSPTHYEMKQESSQICWYSKKDWTQEAAFVIVGEISPDARLSGHSINWGCRKCNRCKGRGNKGMNEKHSKAKYT